MMLSLLVTQFISLTLFAIASVPAGKDGHACIVLASLDQLFFLATLTWTNAIAIDITYSIHKLALQSNSKKRFVAYLCYSFGVPLLLTLIPPVLHVEHEKVSLERPVYRNQYLCFLDDAVVIYSLFLAPVCILISLNVILCVACLLRVTRGVDISSNDKDRTKKNIITCIKLSVCLGIGWIFLFPALIFDGLWPVVLVFVELQGVLLVTANLIGWDCIRKLRSKSQSFLSTPRIAGVRSAHSTELASLQSAKPLPAVT